MGSVFNRWYATGICLMFITGHALASGFPMRKGKALLSPYLSYFAAHAYRDLSGNKISYGNNGKFSSVTAQLYLEYGLTDKLDLVAKLPLSAAQYKDDLQRNSNTTLTDLELGLKYNLIQFNQDRYFFSTQAMAYIPMYSNNKMPFAGYGQFGTEFKLLLSGSPSDKSYFNVETGYRQYFGNNAGNVGQITYLATSGLYIGKNNQLMGELNGVSSFKSSQFNPTNLAYNTQFTFVKASFGVGQRVVKDSWIFAGIFHDVLNRNSGIGEGFSLTGIIRW